jgi:hypothetical protein
VRGRRAAPRGAAALTVYAASRAAVCCAADVAAAAPRATQLDTHGATAPRPPPCQSTANSFSVRGARGSTLPTTRAALLFGAPLRAPRLRCAGRPEAVYFHGPEGRGACLPVPGDKRLLACAGGVLLVLSAGASDAGGPPAARRPRSPAAATPAQRRRRTPAAS